MTHGQLKAEALGPTAGKNLNFHTSTPPSSAPGWYLDLSSMNGLPEGFTKGFREFLTLGDYEMVGGCGLGLPSLLEFVIDQQITHLARFHSDDDVF